MRLPTRVSLPRRHRREESGQALVEFAIVVPVIVMVLLFAIWFYELIYIRLKTQEASRYAAWEATAYRLHDYDQGGSANSQLAAAMQQGIMADTMVRYSNLDSARFGLGLQQTIFSASWTTPVVVVTNASEEQVPGGAIVNLLFSVAGSIFDWLSAKNYQNPNIYAQGLAGASDAGQGMSMKYRMFGHNSWGFNKQGYVEARVGVLVQNNFIHRGVGNMLVSGKNPFLYTEKHGVLADSWRLDTGEDVYNNIQSPGYAKSRPYWKQVDRMFFVSPAARQVARGYGTLLRGMLMAALGLSGSTASSGTNDLELVAPAVVSRNFGNTSHKGQSQIRQDRGSVSRYDTAPKLGEYEKTFNQRGRYFMGCDKEMSLGCPSSTLQQDNPFGGYIVRE